MQQSDGEKSDQDLVVDDSSEINPMSPVSNQMHNGTMSPRENGIIVKKMEHSDSRLGPHSPRSGTSSNASTPSNKKLEDKPSTPVSKSVTPTNSQSNGLPPGSMMKGVVKPPVLNPGYPPHYLGPLNGAPPPELQAAYGPAGVPGLPPGLAGYPRVPLQPGYDPHPQLRAPPSMGGLGGKP